MIVIIGGGLAGTAAALKASDAGKEVILLERRSRLGGATWSFQKEGIWLDNGQHVFLRCCDEYREFLKRIGSADKVHLQSRLNVPVVKLSSDGTLKTSSITRRGKNLLGSILNYGHISLREKARLIRTALALRKLNPADPELDLQSFGEWLQKKGETQNSIDALWNLIILPTVNMDCESASLKLAAKVFVTGLLQDASAADIGWGKTAFSQLHDQPAQKALSEAGVKVEFKAHIQKVELAKDSGDSGSKHKVWQNGECFEAEQIIFAVPHTEIIDLLPQAVFGEGANPQALGTSPIVNVHLVYDRKVLNTPLLAGLGTEVQYVFDRTEASGLDPKEGQCLAVSLSAADKYLGQPAKDLEAFFNKELSRLLPAAQQAKLLFSMVTRENNATFKGTKGTHRHRPAAKTPIRGIFLAGAWTDTEWPATMEGAVRSGNVAAQAALEERS